MDENILKWIADYSEGSIGEEDWLRLKRWVEEKPEHRVIFDDYLRVYRNAHEIGFMEKMDAERSWRALERKLRRGHRMMVVRWMVAASVVFGGAVGGWLLLAKNGARENVPVAEAIPGKAAVKLFMADGKSVTLSENQSLDLIEKDGTEIRKDTAKGLVYGAENVVEKSVLHTLDVRGRGIRVDTCGREPRVVEFDDEVQVPDPLHGDDAGGVRRGGSFLLGEERCRSPVYRAHGRGAGESAGDGVQPVCLSGRKDRDHVGGGEGGGSRGIGQSVFAAR